MKIRSARIRRIRQLRSFALVGVVRPYRKHGEFSGPDVNMAFFRKSLTNANGNASDELLVRVRPGTSSAFEERWSSICTA